MLRHSIFLPAAMTATFLITICAGCDSNQRETQLPPIVDAQVTITDQTITDQIVTDMTVMPLDMFSVDSQIWDAMEIPDEDLTQDMDLQADVGSELESDAVVPPTVDNVLIIIADDLGLDAINGFGFSESAALTPTIDAFCEGGLRFLSAYSHPTCSPTRASILTGRYPFRTGVGGPVGGAQPGLPLREVTIPERLDADLGESVSHAVIGKWHLADTENGDNESPNLHGFEHYAGLIRGTLSDYWDWEKVTNGVVSQSDVYATTDTVSDAVDWLAGREGPWFLIVALSSPHTPIHVAPNALHSRDGLAEGPCPEGLTYDCFMSMIEAMDSEVGRLISSISDTQRERTQIFFVGDNGTANGVLRGYPARTGKDTLFEGGVHIPMCSNGPMVIEPGRSTDALTDVSDLFATTLDLMGARPHPNVAIDGHSLRTVLLNDSTGEREVVLSELGFSMNSRTQLGKALRSAEYTLIRYANEDLFFHRPSDPFERINLLQAPLTAPHEAAYADLSEKLNALQ